MPVQKGKRRKRPRRRGPLTVSDMPETTESSSARPITSKVRRRGFQPPLWVNLAFGIGMIVFGVVFTITPQKGMSTQNRLLLLLAYCVIAGFYLFRAFRQYRNKRQSQE
jgi:hypothetical protein